METESVSSLGGGAPTLQNVSSSASKALASGVLEVWKGINLDGKRAELDQQGLEIADGQENSLKSRKKLAEVTKTFAKQTDDEKLKTLRQLLKSYQEEVDRLTVRAKFAENAFLSLYKLLYEAPDPVPALSAALEDGGKVAELEAMNRKLKSELDEYKAEFSLLKNQEVTIRRLEEKNRQWEVQMDLKVQETVELKEKQFREEAQRQAEVAAERERELQRLVQQAQDALVEARKQHDGTQNTLFDLKNRMENMQAAKQSELDMLSTEIERSSIKIVQLERERNEYRMQLESFKRKLRVEDFDGVLDRNKDLEADGAQKESQIAQLSDQLRAVQLQLDSEKVAYDEKIKLLHETIQKKDVALDTATRELQQRPTQKQLDQLRNQLKNLQAVEFNHIESEDGETLTLGPEQKLESMLLNKNRQLDALVTRLKVALADTKQELAQKVAATSALEAQLSDHRTLVTKLEEDIVKIRSHEGVSTPVPEPPPVQPPAGTSEKDLGDLLSSNQWGSEAPEPVPSTAVSAAGGAASSQQHSMLEIVRAQRDRFRKRMHELETETQKFGKQLQAAQTEVQSLKSDNLTLYEKIRYLQSYPDIASNKAKPSAPRTKRQVSAGGRDLEMQTDSDAVEVKYRQLYDDNLNPFTVFNQKIRQEKYKKLSVPERITLRGSEIFLSSKFFRTFLFFYSVALHILVFLTLYTLSTYTCEPIHPPGPGPLP